MCSSFLYSPSHATHSSASLLSQCSAASAHYFCHSANSFSQISILLHIYSHRASRTQYLRVDLPKLHGISPPTLKQKRGLCYCSSLMHQVILRPSLVCGSFCTSTGQPGSHCSTFRWSFKIVCDISTSSQAKNRQQSLCNCSSHCYMHSCTPRQFCISSHLHGISTFLDTLNAVCGSDNCPKLTACAFAKKV